MLGRDYFGGFLGFFGARPLPGLRQVAFKDSTDTRKYFAALVTVRPGQEA